MAIDNKFISTNLNPLEDQEAAQYHAFANADSLLANNADEATGIIQGKRKTNEHTSIGYIGEMKFAAGGAVAKDANITVVTSGWLTQADSNDAIVGVAKNSVTSGSIGTGWFSFPVKRVVTTGVPFAVTADGDAAITAAGIAYDLSDNKAADAGVGFSGLSTAAIGSGATGFIIVAGIAQATFADSYGIGQNLIATTSGYMTTTASGDQGNAVTLTAATSGVNGTVVIKSVSDIA